MVEAASSPSSSRSAKALGHQRVRPTRQAQEGWLGRGIDEAEAKKRYRQLIGDLTEDNSLPPGWSPPWREPAKAKQRKTRFTWEAMFEHVLDGATGTQRGVLEA
ncbi:MAG: hypothetical protein AAFZ65_10860, partial [Planctomycetota bacterium]